MIGYIFIGIAVVMLVGALSYTAGKIAGYVAGHHDGYKQCWIDTRNGEGKEFEFNKARMN